MQTYRVGDTVHIGEIAFKGFLLSIIKAHRFQFDGKNPKAVAVPDVSEVDGVEIKYGDEPRRRGKDS